MGIESDAGDRDGIFAGDDPFELARAWLSQAAEVEPNDPDAASLATVDEGGLPDVRVVLMRQIEDAGFVFFTNRDGAKGRQIAASGQAAFVWHWKSLRRQIRVRGLTEWAEDAVSDAYFANRGVESRLGAWASEQSRPLTDRAEMLTRLEALRAAHGDAPPRPPHWGGVRIRPLAIEFWADGAHRLHDRFAWTRPTLDARWTIRRLNP
ncbi:MAG: pyridoxamine 5'-phosphate oxidase [Paracoccaceae bacterium]